MEPEIIKVFIEILFPIRCPGMSFAKIFPCAEESTIYRVILQHLHFKKIFVRTMKSAKNLLPSFIRTDTDEEQLFR